MSTTHPPAESTRGRPPARRRRLQPEPRSAALPRETPQTRAHEKRRILDLLRRGAGVTQILRETRKPGDTAAHSLVRATRLQMILEALPAATDPHAPRMEPRKFTRTLAYLEHRIGLLKAEAEWTQHSRPHGPVTTDSHGVQVQVQDGVPSFTMIGVRDDMQRIIGEDLRKRLGTRWPLRRITVVPPDGWAPSDAAMTSLAYAIHIDDAY